MNFAELLRPVPAHATFSEPGYFVWCGSVVRANDDQYHLFYSRWPVEYGFDAWVTRSEVAHAVSSDLLGPYRFHSVALPERGDNFWDGHCTHNPTVHRFGDRFYLYYMGNRGDRRDDVGFNWSHRNAQRIGVAVADSPYGPWERADSPLIETAPGFHDALCCANPSVTRGPEGDFLMVYKGVAEEKPLPFGGPVTHIVATSHSPAGPFLKHPDPVFTAGPEVLFPAEDPFIWFQDGSFWAIVKDMEGYFTGAGKSLALMTSMDGAHWEKAEHCLVSGLQYETTDGERVAVSLLERPQLFLEDGIPKALFCAAFPGPGQRGLTWNVAIPLGS